jgi:hypothetical protein
LKSHHFDANGRNHLGLTIYISHLFRRIQDNTIAAHGDPNNEAEDGTVIIHILDFIA